MEKIKGITIVILQIQYLILAGIGTYALILYLSKSEIRECVQQQFVPSTSIDTIFVDIKNKYAR
jgi:hypothetical protein